MSDTMQERLNNAANDAMDGYMCSGGDMENAAAAVDHALQYRAIVEAARALCTNTSRVLDYLNDAAANDEGLDNAYERLRALLPEEDTK